MSIETDFAALARRIAEIGGSPLPPLQIPPLSFADMLGGGAPSASVSRSVGLHAIVRRAAIAGGLDPALVDAVVEHESGFDPNATSSAGAQGLMQLMPTTAHALGVGRPYDPVENVTGGVRYLRELLDRFRGDLPLALAAYNAGPAAVARYGGVPPYAQTRRYVDDVLATYRRSRSDPKNTEP